MPCIREWTAVFGPDCINKGWKKEYDGETTEICQPPEIFCSVYNMVDVPLISLVALSQCGKWYKSSSRTVFMENVDLKDFCISTSWPGRSHNWQPGCQTDPRVEPVSCHSYRSWWSAPCCCGLGWVGCGPCLASLLQKFTSDNTASVLLVLSQLLLNIYCI